MATAMMDGSFASPAANADYAKTFPTDSSLLSRMYGGLNIWTVVLTTLLMLVVYDQCKLKTSHKLLNIGNSNNNFFSQLHLE